MAIADYDNTKVRLTIHPPGRPSIEIPPAEDTWDDARAALSQATMLPRKMLFGQPHYRGPGCRWCGADDYAEVVLTADGDRLEDRCPRCGERSRWPTWTNNTLCPCHPDEIDIADHSVAGAWTLVPLHMLDDGSPDTGDPVDPRRVFVNEIREQLAAHHADVRLGHVLHAASIAAAESRWQPTRHLDPFVLRTRDAQEAADRRARELGVTAPRVVLRWYGDECGVVAEVAPEIETLAWIGSLGRAWRPR